MAKPDMHDTQDSNATTPGATALQAALTRRAAIRGALLMLGGAALIGCRREAQEAQVEAAAEKVAGALPDGPIGDFSVQEIAYLDEIAETILPATATPGAKAAKVGAFIAVMVTDTYAPEERPPFMAGMKRIDQASIEANGQPFMQATAEQRLALLGKLDSQARQALTARREAEKKAKASGAQHAAAGSSNTKAEAEATQQQADTFFLSLKELAFLGYFTSEIGCTQALRYTEVPGRYDPCVPYVPGTPSWASHA